MQVLTHAGEVVDISSKGKVLSQKLSEKRTFQPQDFQTVSDPAALVEARKHAVPQRLVKYVLSNNDEKAVIYWGGRVELFVAGQCKAAQLFGQDITAGAWVGSQLILGDADGQLMAIAR